MASVPPIAARESSAAHQSGFGRWLLVLAAGLVVVSLLGYRVLSKNRSLAADAEVATELREPAATVAPSEGAIAEPASAASAASATSASATPATEITEPAPPGSASSAAATSAAAAASAVADSATPGASASAAPLPAPATEIRKVTVKSKPPKVRFFHFGRPVGTTPFVLELKPGERHAYEAGLPGYGTRKIVIDGSKPEVVVGLARATP